MAAGPPLIPKAIPSSSATPASTKSTPWTSTSPEGSVAALPVPGALTSDPLDGQSGSRSGLQRIDNFNRRVDFDGLAVEQCRSVAPLAHGFDGGFGKVRIDLAVHDA